MTNSINTTVVEVMKNTHDSYNGLMTANVKANHMTVLLHFMSSFHEILTGYDVMVNVKMS